MTSIKPPGSSPTDLPTISHPPTTCGAEAVGSTSAAHGAGSASFSEQLQAARGATVQAPTGPAGDAVAALSRELQAGRLTTDQALDALVERAAAGVAAHLGPEQRAELLTVLRTALASDPTLAALRDTAR
jgi:hypothetical protein